MLRILIRYALLVWLGMTTHTALAQFSFVYTGPDTLYVDESCTTLLDWGHPETPTAGPTMPGQVVISFEIYSISGGYEEGGPVPFGQVVTVFYQAQDNMGNFALFGFNLFIRDTIAPEFDPLSLPEDITINCGEEIVEPFIEYDDNCASDTTFTELTLEEEGQMNVCDGGVITRTWTVTDESGNTVQYVQTITVNPDSIAPVITIPPVDGAALCGEAMDAYTTWIGDQRASIMATDNGCGVMDITDNAPNPAVLQGFCGDIEVDFFVSDSCGNETFATATFSVTNDVAPSIDIPASNGMTACASGDPIAEFEAWLSDRGGAEASDDCSFVSWSTIPEEPSLADTCEGAIIVTFVVDDGCGNTATTEAQFILQDTVPPVIGGTVQHRIVNCSSQDYLEALGAWIDTMANTSASDLCTPQEELLVLMEIGGVPVDSAGIQAAIQDSFLTGCVDGVIIDGLIWNDVLAMIEVDFIYVDACGNSASVSAIFAVRDPSAPVFTTPPQDQLLSCSEGNIDSLFVAWYNSGGNAVAEDGCGDVTLTGFPSQAAAMEMLMLALDTACGAEAAVEVTFVATDFCGNMSADSLSAMFGVVDTLGPSLTAAAQDIEFACNGDAQVVLQAWLDTLGGAQANDLCSSLMWSFSWQAAGDTLSGLPGEGPYPDVADIGCITPLNVTFVASDQCGNAISTGAAFLFVDTVPPVITLDTNMVVVSCDETPSIDDLTVTDNCSASPIVTFTDEMIGEPDTTGCGQFSGMLLRTWSATDQCGNVATATQMIEVSDTEPPAFAAPPDTSLTCAGALDPAVTGMPTGVIDNCDGAPSITFSDQMDGSGCNVAITRLWTATDACGNATTATQQITLIDTMPPDLLASPGDVVLGCDSTADINAAFANWINTGAGISLSDGCGNTAFFVAQPGSYTLGDTSTYPGTPPVLPDIEECMVSEGNVILQVSAEVVYYDPCGNSDFAEVQFILEDNTPPVIPVCSPPLTEIVGEGTCEATFTIEPPAVAEGCFATRDTVQETITLPVTSQAPGNDSIPVDPLQFAFTNLPVPPGAAIDPVSLEITMNGVDADSTTEFFIVTGDEGFALGQTQNVEEECDTGSTTLVIPADLLNMWAADGVLDIVLTPHIPGQDSSMAINDVCDGATVTILLEYVIVTPHALRYAYQVDSAEIVELDSFGVFDLSLQVGIHALTLYVTDCAGNMDSCTTELTALDTIAPQIFCPADIEMAAGDGGCTALVVLRYPEIIENCMGQLPQFRIDGATTAVLMPFAAPGDSVEMEFEAGVSVVTYIVADHSGNMDSCTFSVTVTDPVPPAAVCMDTVLYVHPSGLIDSEILPGMIDAQSDDNCGVDTVIVQPSLFNCDSAGTLQIVNLVVVDASGNRDTCVASVRIEVEPFQPSYEMGICSVDTLRLFANAPDAPGNMYTYSWTGPNGFVSIDANPAIPDAGPEASGVYTVMVTSTSGCESVAQVDVEVPESNAPSLSGSAATICLGDSMVLTASGYDQDVMYAWHQGTAPNGVLLGTTADSTFTVMPPAVDDYTYYVVIETGSCSSDPSVQISLSVVTAPESMVDNLFVEVCAGDSVLLGTQVTGDDITYAWTGPGGFMSDQQFPVIDSATAESAGNYSLVVLLGACASEPATTVVSVDPRPDKPMITSDSLYCEGGDLTLTAENVTDADQYVWINPSGVAIPTATNILTINNVTDDADGGWIVTAYYGDCPSEMSDTALVVVEDSLILEATNTGPGCMADSVMISVLEIPGATYAWEGPEGFTSDQPVATISAIAGVYTVTVTTSSGCTATASTEVGTTEPPVITAVNNTAGVCTDGTQDLTFSVTVFPEDDGTYTYQWTGPNGFISNDSIPVIPNLTSDDNGMYVLTVFRGECASESFSTEVDVADSPQQPSIAGTLEYCQGDDFVLSAPAYGGDSVLYTWSTPTGVLALWNDSTLEITAVQPLASGSYSVIVTIDGCPSQPSESIAVTVTPALDAPVIDAPAAICAGDSLRLQTEVITDATYQWSGPGGFASTGVSPVIFPVGAGNAGAYQVVIQSGACTSPPSAEFVVEVLPLPATPAIEAFTGSVCLDAPDAVTLCIEEGSLTAGATYIWTHSGSGEVLAEVSDAACVTISDFSAFTDGVNEIVVTATLDGCSSATSAPASVEAHRFPEEQADAGQDAAYCLDEIVMLGAEPPDIAAGMWSSPDGGITFDDPEDPATQVGSLQPGGNVLIWSLDFASCVNYSADTVVIFLEGVPSPLDDSIFVEFGMTTNFDVTLNDALPDLFTLDIITSPERGNVLHQGNGRFVYAPNIGFVGADMMSYEVCSAICPEQCVVATVFLQVGDENDCFVPTIFTPNEDGVNDRLIIPCLETDRYPDNRVIIFSEWGDAVFESAPYFNDWDGKRKGDDVPVGTYFYVVDFGDGSAVRKGFLIIER